MATPLVGIVEFQNSSKKAILIVAPDDGNLFVGGKGAKGDLFVYAASVNENTDGSKATIQLDGGTGNVFLRNAGKNRVVFDAVNGNMYVGGNGAKGDVFVYSADIGEVLPGS